MPSTTVQTIKTEYGNVAADLRLGGSWNLRFTPDQYDKNNIILSASGPSQDLALKDLLRNARLARS